MVHTVNQAKSERHCDDVERLMSKSLYYVSNKYSVGNEFWGILGHCNSISRTSMTI